MRSSDFVPLLHAEWARFRAGRGRLLAVAASVLITVSLGLLITGGARTGCVTSQGEGACPPPLLGPDGTAVRDSYYFVHQPLTGDGSITARVSDLTGQMRLPDAAPGVRTVEEGSVPWGKAGLLVRASLAQGTPYAAVMVTGGHGVRMQHDFVHDAAGGPGREPQWLRLTRSGDTVTGYESGDGTTWTEVDAVEVTGLAQTVEIGLFATSPGVLWDTAKAFSQTTATFDRVDLRGTSGAWQRDDVGVALGPDGRTPHHPGGVVESGDRFVVSGGGDIGPSAPAEGGLRADLALIGGSVGLVPLLGAAAAFAVARHRRPGTEPHPAHLLAAGAVVVGAVAFVTGLVASGIVVPVGLALMRAHQNPIQPITTGTGLRVVVGYAALAAVAAVLAMALAVLVRRSAVAIGLVVALVVAPHLLATAGLAPWLLTVTPAAGFAITQSVPTFAHVAANPSPITGYYPLPPWAGFAVACGYAVLALGAAIAVERRLRTAASSRSGGPA